MFSGVSFVGCGSRSGNLRPFERARPTASVGALKCAYVGADPWAFLVEESFNMRPPEPKWPMGRWVGAAASSGAYLGT